MIRIKIIIILLLLFSLYFTPYHITHKQLKLTSGAITIDNITHLNDEIRNNAMNWCVFVMQLFLQLINILLYVDALYFIIPRVLCHCVINMSSIRCHYVTFALPSCHQHVIIMLPLRHCSNLTKSADSMYNYFLLTFPLW